MDTYSKYIQNGINGNGYYEKDHLNNNADKSMDVTDGVQTKNEISCKNRTRKNDTTASKSSKKIRKSKHSPKNSPRKLRSTP